MLIEFKVGNFRSYKDEQTLSMVASNDTSLPDNCISAGKFKLLKTVAVYGPNASGKSNLIKAASAAKELVLNSTSLQPGRPLGLMPFLLDDETEKGASSFEFTFIHENVRYQYGFAADNSAILEEWLFAYPKGRAVRWFERNVASDKKWEFGTALKGDKVTLAERTRPNTLFLSVGAKWNNEQLTHIYHWFRRKLQTIGPRESLRHVTKDLLWPPPKERDEESTGRVVADMLKAADLGICDVKIEEIDIDNVNFPPDMPDRIKTDIMRDMKRVVHMQHHNEQTNKSAWIPLDDESDGTQRYFDLIAPWMIAFTEGVTVLVDELESSLHPLLARRMVEEFHDTELNDSGAQLIFATHDTTLLDPKLLRRDQIWFTEKSKEGATKLYSLADYKERVARKGESFQKGYLAGRYGAIPILEAFSEV